MANIIKRVWNQNRMVQIEDLKGMTFQAEQAGHTFEISGIDDAGNTVALTGTPAGVFLRPDNTDVALTCSVSGGKVSATLPANCYDVPGRFAITIFITSGGSKTAIYAAIGTVSRTSSGTAAPGTTQSVVDLINAINAAINSIPASYSSLLADIAPDYSNSALYSVGQYAWYDGDLKRCIVPITTAESYTAAHWTSAVLGQDVSDLKSALNGFFVLINGNKYSAEQDGYYVDRTTGNFVENTNQSYQMTVVKDIPVIGGKTIKFDFSTVPIAAIRGGAFYNSTGAFAGGITFTVDTLTYTLTVPANATKMAFTLFNHGNYKITYDISVYSVYSDEVNTNKMVEKNSNTLTSLNGFYTLINGNAYATETDGYYVEKSNGTLVQNALTDHTMKAVQNIPVQAGETIKLKFQTVPVARGGAFYKPDGTFAGGITYVVGTTDYTLTVPADAVKMAITVIDDSNYQVIYGFSELSLLNRTGDIENSNLKDGNAYESVKNNKFVYHSNGNLGDESASGHTSRAVMDIPVIEGTTLVLTLSKVPLGSARGAAFYGESGNYISGIQYTAGTLKYTAVVPKSAVTFGFTASDSATYSVGFKTDFISIYEYSKEETEKQITNNNIHNAVCISDTFEYTQGHNPNCIIDESKGIMYTVYLAGHGYGDGASEIALAVTPLAQPERTKYKSLYNFAEGLGNPQGVDPVPILKDSSTLRVFFTTATVTAGMFYIDYNIGTDAISEPVMCKFNNGSETIDFTASAFVSYMTAQGKAPSYTQFFLIGSHMVYHGSAYYCNVDIPSTGGYPLVIKTTDNGATFVPCGIIPTTNVYESDLAFIGNDMYVFLRESTVNFYISHDNGETFEESMVVPNASARPRIIKYNDKALLVFPKNVRSPYGIASSRTNAHFYLGTGDTFSGYDELFYAYDDFGIAVPDVINYNGILYMVFGSGELFAISQSSPAKDLLKFYCVGDLR